MANIALGKSIMEPAWERQEQLTDNNYSNYTGGSGFTKSNWPQTMTLDLGNVFDIDTIRFLLWDKDARVYKYRLLTSEDLITWQVHFETFETGYRSWQEFKFTGKIQARYIRLHCLWNSVNVEFHIVEMQVYDTEPDAIEINISNKRVISPKDSASQNEVGTGLPLTQRIKDLTNNLERIIDENSIINPTPFRSIINSFRLQVNDIETLEMSIDSIRREIIGPVQKELTESKKLGRFSVWGFYVGFASIIVSIFAILNGLFGCL